MDGEACGAGCCIGEGGIKGECDEIAFDDGAGEVGGLSFLGGIANRHRLLRQQVLSFVIREELKLE